DHPAAAEVSGTMVPDDHPATAEVSETAVPDDYQTAAGMSEKISNVCIRLKNLHRNEISIFPVASVRINFSVGKNSLDVIHPDKMFNIMKKLPLHA
ncbi:hypothetical protein EB259_25075, partial [Salmonella enterica]|nr:hypothetical protein [Salmonella enterica]